MRCGNAFKALLTLFFGLVSFLNCIAQEIDREEKCSNDTVTIDRRMHIVLKGNTYFRGVECTRVSNLGIRLEAGPAFHHYNEKTEAWLGHHIGPSLGFEILYKKWGFGVRAKAATISPKTELIFEGDTITSSALVNPNKVDYFLSYTIDIKHNITLEPSLGISRNSFRVINEDELGKTFDIPKCHGATAGVSLNKYFAVRELRFLGAFVNYRYSFVNFTKVNELLGRGYSELTLGVAYKVFYKRYYVKPI